MIGPYAKIGAKLVERGYSAIPIICGTKRPGFGNVGLLNWRNIYTSRLPTEKEVEEWSSGDSGVGVLCGEASRGLVGVDIDTNNLDIRNAITSAIPNSHVIKVGAKGGTLFFRGYGITESVSWNIGPIRACDLIGPGRQTLLPPTIHPDTKLPYIWIRTHALEDVDIEELPEFTLNDVENIGEALKPFGWVPRAIAPTKTETINLDDNDDPFRRLNNDALMNLHKWVPALGLYKCRPARGGYESVASYRPSGSGKEMDKRNLNLHIHPKGIIDFGDNDRGYTPIDLVIKVKGYDFDSAFKFLSGRLWESPPSCSKQIHSLYRG